jgi:hypothetical protein
MDVGFIKRDYLVTNCVNSDLHEISYTVKSAVLVKFVSRLLLQGLRINWEVSRSSLRVNPGLRNAK